MSTTRTLKRVTQQQQKQKQQKKKHLRDDNDNDTMMTEPMDVLSMGETIEFNLIDNDDKILEETYVDNIFLYQQQK